MEQQETKHLHPWKVSLTVGILMILLGFIGLILTNVQDSAGWTYWRTMVPIFATLSLFLNGYLKKKGHRISVTTIWQELLHWVGLFCAVYLISHFVDMGIFSRFVASLSVVTLLALSVYLVGIYIELIFIPIGLLLGGVAASVAFFEAYIYYLMIPVGFLAAGLVLWLAYRHKS